MSLKQKKEEWDKIAEDVRECSACDLLQKGKKVMGDGNPNAKIMIIGEAPGAEEEEQRKPFVGESGEMLNKLLKEKAGLERKFCYVSNIVKCRPTDNKTPNQNEINTCKKHLENEINILKPDVILFVGASAAQLVSNDKMEDIHGKEFSYNGIPAFVVYHTSPLANRYSKEREEDFQKFGNFARMKLKPSNNLVWIMAFLPLLLIVPAGNLIGVISMFLALNDATKLVRNGLRVSILQWISAILLPPVYLFIRATKTNKKYGYAIVWCVSFVLYVVVASVMAG